MARTDSNDRPSGPPRLTLAGNKPTWRERQAAKEAAEAAGGSPAPPAPPVENAEEANPPRKTGYVPPARRGADSGAAPAPRGRPDIGPPRPSLDRGDSTSQEPTARWRPGVRGGNVGREESPADNPRPTSSSGDAQAPDAATRPAPGKYVPVHLRNK